MPRYPSTGVFVESGEDSNKDADLVYMVEDKSDDVHYIKSAVVKAFLGGGTHLMPSTQVEKRFSQLLRGQPLLENCVGEAVVAKLSRSRSDGVSSGVKLC